MTDSLKVKHLTLNQENKGSIPFRSISDIKYWIRSVHYLRSHSLVSERESS